MIWVLLIISIILLVSYLAAVLFQRSYAKRANEVVEEKDKLAQINVRQALLDARKLSLTGKSLHEYQQLEADYNDIENSKFLHIDQLANSVVFDSRGLNVFKTRDEFNTLNSTLKETKAKIASIQGGLEKLNEVDQEHRKAVDELRLRYDKLRKKILAESFKYGPASEPLENVLSGLEDNFAKFVKLTESGDHTAATDVYEQLRVETNDLEKKMIDIPPLYDKLVNRYPTNFKELQNGADQLTKQGFVFDADPNVVIADMKKSHSQILNALKNLDMKKTADAERILEVQIKTLYDTIENEYGAEYDVKKNDRRLTNQLKHVRAQNQELTLEIDRLAHRFTLSHSEVEDTRGWGEQIKSVSEQNEESKKRWHEKKAPFTAIREIQNGLFEQLDQIAKNQKDLYITISSYPQVFDDLKRISLQYSGELSNIRRILEQVDMPGLPADYRLQFISVKDEIKALNNMVSASRVNLDDAQRQAHEVTTDLADLKSSSSELYVNANLAVELIHYANRFSDRQEIISALQQARLYYERDLDYGRTVDLVGRALDQVDPGSYERLKDGYTNRNQTPF
ncbi:septation ring formation regulator EzrA [Oenococcus oeni]|uniref:septation ring formation regulator EzrA n=1 Tax=Oenococcus oeni TaxID=1247 RepID=UPI0008F8D38B|nr:septation ring formation regulator EzrA [Oenococcus oeni]OIL19704.1 septation ring formation regulator EzrA [Oenococcus oeni]OIL24102.1 septation ring formation regulator EzrA [Oenococcus oeni]OIL41390.1 septation ring formation regulator EzrA [Oenococcus oeni]OIL47990.1 septation ring formation regulator EzrA [Oenococcus oeni]OIL51720.1 septation ring formation regulator EzrA [Oenococcus oeni]